MNLLILKKPILSEKTTKLMEKGIYTFLVGKEATKKNIAVAVKNQFGTDVVRVNIAKIKPKTKRIANTRKHTQVGGGKKAIVYLKAGQSITILSPKTESKKIKKISKDKDVEKVSAEGKEA